MPCHPFSLSLVPPPVQCMHTWRATFSRRSKQHQAINCLAVGRGNPAVQSTTAGLQARRCSSGMPKPDIPGRGPVRGDASRARLRAKKPRPDPEAPFFPGPTRKRAGQGKPHSVQGIIPFPRTCGAPGVPGPGPGGNSVESAAANQETTTRVVETLMAVAPSDHKPGKAQWGKPTGTALPAPTSASV